MGYGCVTSDLVPRLAWGVGRLTKPQRSHGWGVYRVASEIKSGGKLLSYLNCLDNNSSKPFFQVLL